MRQQLPRRTWRRFVPLLVAAIMFGLSATACTSGDESDRVRDLEAQIAALEADLEAARSAASPDGGTSTPVATPAPHRIDTFGFVFTVPSGVMPETAGTSGPEATAAAGQITAADGSVSASLLWATASLTPEEAVVGAFDLLRAAASDLVLQPTNQGAFEVDGQPGAFGAFQVQEAGSVQSVGIVGGWSCGERSFALTVLGADVATVEQAFAALVESFSCGA